MNVDVHAHWIPDLIRDAAAQGEVVHGIGFSSPEAGSVRGTTDQGSFSFPEWFTAGPTIDQRIEQMGAGQVDTQVLSVANSLFRYDHERRHAVPLAQSMNDELIEVCTAHPDRFLGFAHLPLQDPKAAIAELERVMGFDPIVGITVGPQVNELNWDDDALFPVLEAAQDLDALIFVHSANGPPDNRMAKYHLRNLVGNPLQTTLVVASLIFGGVFDRLPELKMCLAHGGGYSVLGSGRFDHGAQARDDVPIGSHGLPTEYLKLMYFDTVTHSAAALRHIVEVVGADRVMLGSDYPADMAEADPVAFVKACDFLSEDDQQAILGGNFAESIGS